MNLSSSCRCHSSWQPSSFSLISFFTAFFFIYLTGSVENVIREQMYTTLETSQDMIVRPVRRGRTCSNFTQSQLRRALTNSQMHLIVDMEEVIAGASDPQLQYLSSESRMRRWCGRSSAANSDAGRADDRAGLVTLPYQSGLHTVRAMGIWRLNGAGVLLQRAADERRLEQCADVVYG